MLADMGCAVTLCEREPVIAAMLAQGLQLAQPSGDEWLRSVVQRMSLFPGDARDPGAMRTGTAGCDLSRSYVSRA